MQLERLLLSGLLAITISLMLACGGGGGGGNSASQAPTITTQPQGVSVPLGQTATFKVVAIGTAPLSYQWSKNGVAISGATQSSYTTPPVSAADDASNFTVVVTNSVSVVTSKAASLTVGPRSPHAGDLRFQQIGAATTVNGYGNAGVPIHTNLLGRLGYRFTNYYGTPLSLGADCVGTGNPVNCDYFFDAFPLPIGVPDLTTNYQSDMLDFFDLDLGMIVAPNTVINGLILEPANNDFAVSWVQSTQSTGFDYAQQTVALSDLQARAAQLGGQGRVITAVSFDALGNVSVVSYGWLSDPTTIYETQIATASLDTVGAEAANLAAQGYIITTLGAGDDSQQGIPSNGLLLVSTRVQGDTLPRPLKVVPDGRQKAELWDQGYAIVAYIFNPNGFVTTWIGEK